MLSPNPANDSSQEVLENTTEEKKEDQEERESVGRHHLLPHRSTSLSMQCFDHPNLRCIPAAQTEMALWGIVSGPERARCGSWTIASLLV